MPGFCDHFCVSVTASVFAKLLKKQKREYFEWKNRNNDELHTSAKKFQRVFLDQFSIKHSVEPMRLFIKDNLMDI